MNSEQKQVPASSIEDSDEVEASMSSSVANLIGVLPDLKKKADTRHNLNTQRTKAENADKPSQDVHSQGIISKYRKRSRQQYLGTIQEEDKEDGTLQHE